MTTSAVNTSGICTSDARHMLDTSGCAKPEGRMHFRGIRSSKFKHVYGLPAKKPQCYDNIKITRNASDANFCAVNPKFLAVVVEVGGGGSFLVWPLDQTGRIAHAVSKVRDVLQF